LRLRLFFCLVLAASGCTDDPPIDPGVCVPGDCTSLGFDCGPHRDGTGACIICGKCTAPNTCGGGGRANVCGCTPPVCGADQCGSLMDTCSGTPVACPVTCAGADTCGGAGEANRCGHRAGHGEACGPTAICGDGDACCGGRCVSSGPGGACPRPGPDMTVTEQVLRDSVFVTSHTVLPTDCAIADACLSGPGTFRLLRFSTQTENVGTADLVIGDPRTMPDDFEFSGCHGHNHYNDYAEYRLVDAAGRQVGRGFKAGFCIEDTVRTSSAPGVPAQKRYFCDPEMGGIQGIQAGWADLYLSTLDCQWIDVTRVPPGQYTLEVEVNPPPRRFHEASYENNVARVPVMIP
jgi:hypothetical protein